MTPIARTLAWAAVTVGCLAAPAMAQRPSFCNNTLVANSFYSNVLSNGRTAEVEYHGQFQNLDPNRRAMTATMLAISRIGNFTVVRPIGHFDLNPYEQKDIAFLSLQVHNPSGTGAPTPVQVGAQIRFACSFR
ncbi:hypothetical protein [Roseococcus sp. YIM B11640]|uniref:hypothetical protein n=1 Tax=Roseococcus sp. YIM B11640 TaxID=3133973 RepID=UPI003C7CE845